MGTLTAGMLIIFLIAGAITALAMLSVFSNVIEHETQLHDLRNRVRKLHYEHAMYLARLQGHIPENATDGGDVLIIEDEPESALTAIPEAVTAQPAAPEFADVEILEEQAA